MQPPAPPSARGLLRVLICGSVDDGKSTLIGRLLHDSRQIMDDTYASIARDSRRYGTLGDEADLALLVDGLEAEREQGITIDVAYRFFSTPTRSFIVADAPGHEQFTRNMATGASNCELAVILIDSRKGVLTQTRRHSTICSLLGIRHVIVAVNKIDLVGHDEAVFTRIAFDYQAFAARLGFISVIPIPLSARFGDNVAERSENMSWYRGPTLLDHLEAADIPTWADRAPFRFPVQWVNRPDQDFRGFSGTIAAGNCAVGDQVVVAGSGRATRIRQIYTADGNLTGASAGDAVTLVLEDELDIARGDLLVPPLDRPPVAEQFAATLLWFGEEHMLPGRQYLMRIGTQWVSTSVTSIRHRIDVSTQEALAAKQLDLNEIGVCHLQAARPVPLDSYGDCRTTGSFILVDRFTNRTVAAGMVAYPLRRAGNIHREPLLVDKAARAALDRQKAVILWFTGLSGSGKSMIAKALERMLHLRGRHTYTLDGDNLRLGLNRDLGFTDADRVENIRRASEVAKLMVDAGLIVICSFISPFRAERRAAREMVEPGEFLEVFVDTPIEECIRRDPKGLYAKAKAGKIQNFTGLDSPYEIPEKAEICLTTIGTTPEDLAALLLERLIADGYA